MTEKHITFENIRLGLRLNYSRTITEADIKATIDLTGDRGGYHIDKKFAQAAGFRDIIAPGMLQAGLVTKLGGDLNFLAREFKTKFIKPVYAGDRLEVTLEVVAIETEREMVTFHSKITNQNGEVVLTGEAIGHLPKAEWGVPENLG